MKKDNFTSIPYPFIDANLYVFEKYFNSYLGSTHRIIMPIEVGDYSIYIHENYTDIRQLILYDFDRSASILKVKEIVGSESGSILYFDRNISDLIKEKHIYPCIAIKKYRNNIRELAYQLVLQGQLSLSDYLNATYI